MPIERYILEFEIGDAITGFSTDFSLSPFGYDGCYDDKQPPCALMGSSPYDMGIDVGRGCPNAFAVGTDPWCGSSVIYSQKY